MKKVLVLVCFFFLVSYSSVFGKNYTGNKPPSKEVLKIFFEKYYGNSIQIIGLHKKYDGNYILYIENKPLPINGKPLRRLESGSWIYADEIIIETD